MVNLSNFEKCAILGHFKAIFTIFSPTLIWEKLKSPILGVFLTKNLFFGCAKHSKMFCKPEKYILDEKNVKIQDLSFFHMKVAKNMVKWP